MAALAAVLAMFVVLGSASADPLRYGVADDWPEFHPCGDVWWSAAADIGYEDMRMTVEWDPASPTAIPNEANLQLAIDCAKLTNIRPILSVFPAEPWAIGSDRRAQNEFASFVALVGQTFPGVQNFVIGNEPNVNRFWQPQYVDGHDAAATDYEHTLARSYDALKLVRPDSIVWGPAISSRGNDNPDATSNPSHSPVWFIKEMGDAYRASGRSLKIFDEFDMHPYPPVQDTDPFSTSFRWPQAGAANLDRIKQALWDAFHGTGQPTVSEQSRARTSAASAPQALPIDLDEAGEQTAIPPRETAAYDGTGENVVPISEAEQAANHVQLAEIAACDPAVRSLMYFPLIDDRATAGGFQSGNLFADLTEKKSYAAMKTKIASAKGVCRGGVRGVPSSWTHTANVVGAAGNFGGPGTSPGSQPEVRRPASAKLWAFTVTAGEDAAYKAVLQRVTATGKPLRTVLTTKGAVRAYHRPMVRFNAGTLSPGRYAFSITFAAATNPQRTTTLRSKSFVVSATG